tara:strand:+ start:606 stop:1838 length:1233 start_codon:yes stop_codon:yes gene_type:complete
MSAVVRDRFFINILNLSQLTKPKTGVKINPEKAREVLDTNIFELLPTQTTRQDQINNFFSEFDTLIGPRPIFEDSNNDGVVENPINYEQDEQSRISFENQSNAFITRLDEQAEGNSVNQGKTLESMRNRLNTYLGDVDNVITNLEDQRPEYENIASGFLKIRKPNQAIIIKAPNDGLLEFQKNNSYLTDGFTITMWVRFVGKTQGGTLFNFGNPLDENGEGFRLETRTNIDSAGNYKRWIRLAVREGDEILRDNHWGTDNRLRRTVNQSDPIDFYADDVIHQLYPNIPTDDLNEWYFICATYNPNVNELNVGADSPLRKSKEYWLNHLDLPYISENNPSQQDIDEASFVSNSGLGAKCKVEIISKSELLRARGYKIGDLSVNATQTTSSDLSEPELEDIPEEEETTTAPA